MMGYRHEEGGDGVWQQKRKLYGRWMIAKRRTVAYASPQGGMRAMMCGRNIGRGRTLKHYTMQRKRSSQEMNLGMGMMI